MPRILPTAAARIAVALVACALQACLQDGAAQTADGRAVVLAPQSSRAPTRSMSAFALENLAQLVCYATMGEPFQERGRDYFRLRIDEVLKGPTAPGTLGADEPLPAFACTPPDAAHPTSSLYDPGTRVLVYMTRHERGWSILSLQRLNVEIATPLAARISRYALVEGAALAPDPPARFLDLLRPEAGGLDEPAYWVLRHNPQDAAVPALMMQLDRAVRATERGPGVADVLVTRLAHVFTFMGRTDAIEPLLIAATRIRRETRIDIYPYLVRLVGKAGEPERVGLKALLLDDLDDPAIVTHAGSYEAVVRGLGRIADHEIITRLLVELVRHKDDGAGSLLPSALLKAMERAGPPDRDRIVATWVSIVEEFQELEDAASPQRDTLRHVLIALDHAELDVEVRARLRRVRDSHPGSWYARQLSAVVE